MHIEHPMMLRAIRKAKAGGRMGKARVGLRPQFHRWWLGKAHRGARFEQSPAGGEGGSHADNWEKSLPERKQKE